MRSAQSDSPEIDRIQCKNICLCVKRGCIHVCHSSIGSVVRYLGMVSLVVLHFHTAPVVCLLADLLPRVRSITLKSMGITEAHIGLKGKERERDRVGTEGNKSNVALLLYKLLFFSFHQSLYAPPARARLFLANFTLNTGVFLV